MAKRNNSQNQASNTEFGAELTQSKKARKRAARANKNQSQS